jgi:DNA-binding GntR family transcriptional regulator
MKLEVVDGKPRQQLPHDVASYVRELIISGEARKGSFLRIEAIAKRMKISTTPVREGLLQLQSESFVRLVPRRGFMVLSFSRQDVRDIFWAQGILAGELARRAALEMSENDFLQIEVNAGKYEDAVKAGVSHSYHKAGHDFHRAINIAARSTRLSMMLGSMVRQLPNRFYGMIEGQVHDTIGYHSRILDALRDRKANEAGKIMRDHIVAGGEHLIAHLESEGVWLEVPEQEAV